MMKKYLFEDGEIKVKHSEKIITRINESNETFFVSQVYVTQGEKERNLRE
jgi:hypothetical protein